MQHPTGAHPEYRPEIDGLRAIAVISVVAFHVNPSLIPGGFAGVDIFFVISGYLVSGIILRALARGSFSCLDFYARRVKRIFPALILVLATVWACGWLILLPDEYRLLGEQIIAGGGFLSNLSMYRDQNWYFGWGGITNPLLHLWSLGVEEQFYLIWPLFLLAIWRLDTRLWLILSVVLASFALNISVATADPLACFYFLWNRLWELSLGGALAYAELDADSVRSAFARVLPWLREPSRDLQGAIGAGLLALSFAGLDRTVSFPGWWGLTPALGALLLIRAGQHSWIGRNVLSQPPMIFVGLISYPLYLWHWPALALTHTLGWSSPGKVAATVGVAVVLAFLTYLYIERPLRSTPNAKPVAVRLGAAMVVVVSVGCLTFLGIIQPRSESNAVDRLVRAATEDWLPNTAGEAANAERARWAHWTLGVDGFITLGNGQRRALFLGDSNIQQYYPRIAKVLSDHPLNTRGAVFAVRAACVPGGVEFLHLRLPEAYGIACRKLIRDAIAYAGDDPNVDTIVIGGNWYGYFAADRRQGTGPGSLKPETDQALAGLKQLILDFVRAGKRVYIILNIPSGAGFDPRQMIRRTVLSPGFEIHSQYAAPRADIVKYVGEIGTRLRQIAQDTGAQVIDPLEFLCDDTSCPAVSPNGEPIYRDATHLRPSYVRESARFLDVTVLDADA